MPTRLTGSTASLARLARRRPRVARSADADGVATTCIECSRITRILLRPTRRTANGRVSPPNKSPLGRSSASTSRVVVQATARITFSAPKRPAHHQPQQIALARHAADVATHRFPTALACDIASASCRHTLSTSDNIGVARSMAMGPRESPLHVSGAAPAHVKRALAQRAEPSTHDAGLRASRPPVPAKAPRDDDPELLALCPPPSCSPTAHANTDRGRSPRPPASWASSPNDTTRLTSAFDPVPPSPRGVTPVMSARGFGPRASTTRCGSMVAASGSLREQGALPTNVWCVPSKWSFGVAIR